MNVENTTHLHAADAAAFQLPEDVRQLQQAARDIVRKELLPLEKQYLLSPNQAHGLKEILNLRRIYSKEVADRLGATAKAIETQKARACTKLGLASRAQIVQFAILQGWLHGEIPVR